MKNNPIFYPWKQEISENMMLKYKDGIFPVLMLDMKPRCSIRTMGNGGCVYCTSRDMKQGERALSKAGIKELIQRAASYGVEWLYICGASEPFDDKNAIYAIEQALEAGLQVVAYTNALFVSPKFASWLFNRGVNLIVKCDSLNESVFNSLMRAKVTQNFARKVIKSIYNLMDAGYGKVEKPSLALSIVTTSVNCDDIPEVVIFCLKNGLFPIIRHAKIAKVRIMGEKKYRTSSRYREETKHWYLPTDESAFLKARVSELIEKPYSLPMCPTPITGMHVTYSGKVKIESVTGLSCSAFTKRQCKNIVVGHVKENSLEEIGDKILHYRESVLSNVEKKRRFRPVFGGCGGTGLLTTYYKVLKEQHQERENKKG